MRQRLSALSTLGARDSGAGAGGSLVGEARPSRYPTNSSPAAAKVLGALLEKLRSASAQGRPGGLALVRTMTEKGGD